MLRPTTSADATIYRQMRLTACGGWAYAVDDHCSPCALADGRDAKKARLPDRDDLGAVLEPLGCARGRPAGPAVIEAAKALWRAGLDVRGEEHGAIGHCAEGQMRTRG